MRPSHAFALVFVLAAAVGAALAGRPAAPTSAGFGPAAAPDSARAALSVRDATVRVNLPGDAHGAGFCRTTENGTVWVWTVAHVAAMAKVTDETGGTAFVPVAVVHRVYAADGTPVGRAEYAATVVRYDESIDVGLLRVTAPHLRVGTLDFAPDPPPLWTPLWCCGSPKGLDQTLTRGVLNYRSRKTGRGEMDQSDAPTLGGNSGGPVTDTAGRVVGLVHGGPGEGFTLFVPARTVRRFAAEQGLLFAYEGTGPAPDVVPGPVEVVRPEHGTP